MHQVYRVTFPHKARESDELELLLGDFVYVDPECWKSSPDGWVEGVSWLTGIINLQTFEIEQTNNLMIFTKISQVAQATSQKTTPRKLPNQILGHYTHPYAALHPLPSATIPWRPQCLLRPPRSWPSTAPYRRHQNRPRTASDKCSSCVTVSGSTLHSVPGSHTASRPAESTYGRI